MISLDIIEKMSDLLFPIIESGASKFKIELPPEAEAVFGLYYEFLEERGQNVNLTALSGIEDVVRLHFLDSIALLNIIDFKNKKVIDIGSGAGFPGLPLKIAEPTIDITLLDATGKRISFLSELCSNLNLKADFVTARAEEAAFKPELREQFDIVVSRAVARLNVLCELCLPFIKTDGVFLAMKGKDSDEEVNEAKTAIEAMGATLAGKEDYTIPDTDIMHRVIIIKKTTSTPEKYPRRFAKIQKSPL